MKYYQFTNTQLDEKAKQLLLEFDPERLERPKPIDVYAVIEKCLDVPYDWKYLTPDQSILGVTAFNEGYMWAWPESRYYDGLMPFKVYCEKGTILIEATLTEQNNRGRENFTVMHEVFHQVLHKKCFADVPADYLAATYSRTIDGKICCKSKALRIIEYQANHCAAAFLMPEQLIKSMYRELFFPSKDNHHLYSVHDTIAIMSEQFSVSKQAMTNRLKYLGIINEKEENIFK